MAEPGPAPTNIDEKAPKTGAEKPVRVLVVDDESGVRNAVARILRNAGMVAVPAENGDHALELLDKEPFDVALLDVRMPRMTGTQLLARMKTARYAAEVIMMT